MALITALGDKDDTTRWVHVKFDSILTRYNWQHTFICEGLLVPSVLGIEDELLRFYDLINHLNFSKLHLDPKITDSSSL